MSADPLPLTSARWRELRQAYGSAEDIGALLAALYANDNDDERTELWYGIWATLCPDGHVYSAAYAAVPHVLRTAADRDFAECVLALHFITQVEVSRHAPGAPGIDDDLLLPYASSIETLPARVVELRDMTWDEQTAQVLAAALLAGKRQHALAGLMLRHGRPATGP